MQDVGPILACSRDRMDCSNQIKIRHQVRVTYQYEHLEGGNMVDTVTDRPYVAVMWWQQDYGLTDVARLSAC